jgi:hypothetical protein
MVGDGSFIIISDAGFGIWLLLGWFMSVVLTIYVDAVGVWGVC